MRDKKLKYEINEEEDYDYNTPPFYIIWNDGEDSPVQDDFDTLFFSKKGVPGNYNKLYHFVRLEDATKYKSREEAKKDIELAKKEWDRQNAFLDLGPYKFEDEIEDEEEINKEMRGELDYSIIRIMEASRAEIEELFEDMGIEEIFLDAESDDDDDWEDGDDDMYDDGEKMNFEEYAESFLPYEARCKEDWMDPIDTAGKGRMNNGECDIMWVCQGDCDYDDFETLIECFGRYYKKETNGNTYVIVMKSRSYPGDGNYIKRIVSFKNGQPTVKQEEAQLLDEDSFELNLYYSEYEDDWYFMIYLSTEGEELLGKTIGEVKKQLEEYLDDTVEYLEFDDGYEFDRNEFDLDFDKPDEYSVYDYLKEKYNDDEEELDTVKEMIDNRDLDPIAEGSYRTYQRLEECLNETVTSSQNRGIVPKLNLDSERMYYYFFNRASNAGKINQKKDSERKQELKIIDLTPYIEATETEVKNYYYKGVTKETRFAVYPIKVRLPKQYGINIEGNPLNSYKTLIIYSDDLDKVFVTGGSSLFMFSKNKDKLDYFVSEILDYLEKQKTKAKTNYNYDAEIDFLKNAKDNVKFESLKESLPQENEIHWKGDIEDKKALTVSEALKALNEMRGWKVRYVYDLLYCPETGICQFYNVLVPGYYYNNNKTPQKERERTNLDQWMKFKTRATTTEEFIQDLKKYLNVHPDDVGGYAGTSPEDKDVHVEIVTPIEEIKDKTSYTFVAMLDYSQWEWD